MQLYRICSGKYAKTLSASGMANRWNEEGERVIYAGSSRALAALEMVVHRNAIMSDKPYKIMVITVPDDKNLVREINFKELPADWKSFGEYGTLQSIGSEWYRTQQTLMLRVPSVLIPAESNCVINSEHPDFAGNVKLLRTEDYLWDQRLL